MKIAYLAAGAAGMYCGSCLHDNTLAAALQSAGHEVALLPLYTPLRTDEPDVSLDRIFYGAINVYLQQKSALFRHTPRFLDCLLDRPSLLGQVGKLASSTDAHDLGALTLSVLRGEDGKQAKELDRLLAWLEGFEPDIVQLTNALLAGLAEPIRRRLGVPVVCGLTGEDLFLSELPDRWRGEVEAELRAHAAAIDGFIATSDYYAGTMRELLAVDGERIHTVHLGIRLDGFPAADDGDGAGATADGDDGFLVGFLARQCPEKGLDLLIDAFVELSEGWPAERPAPRLAVAGYTSRRDRDWVAALHRRVEDTGLADRAALGGEVDRDEKIAFLSRLDALALPTVYREPKGLPALEAMACGVPCVLPRHGAFPELVEHTGGGILIEPGSSGALAAALRELADRPGSARELGRRGHRAVHDRFHTGAMAAATHTVYERVLATAAGTATDSATG